MISDKLKKLKIKNTVSWNNKEIEIISQLNRFFEREGMDIYRLCNHDGNECFLLLIEDKYAKIYKTNENEFVLIDITIDGEYYNTYHICNLKELITTRLHLYVSFGYDTLDGKDSIVGEDISWEEYAEKLIS